MIIDDAGVLRQDTLIIYRFGNLRVDGIFEIKFKKISNKIAKLGYTRR